MNIRKNTVLTAMIAVIIVLLISCTSGKKQNNNNLVWSDEFDYYGLPDSTIFPQSLVVDWMRVYRKKERNE